MHKTWVGLGVTVAYVHTTVLKAAYWLSHSEEHTIGEIISPVPGDLHSDGLDKGLSTKPYSILCSTCFFFRFPGTGGHIYPLSSNVLLNVPEAVSCHNEVRSRSAVQSILCVAPRCS